MMNRGDVWWVDFSKSKSGEIRKTRPAIIVSNNSANKFLNRIQVVPLSSLVAKFYPSEAIVTFGGKQNKALADQITTAAKERLTSKAGQLSAKDMASVDRVIKLQLGL
jgi:mRNA interferase MazF